MKTGTGKLNILTPSGMFTVFNYTFLVVVALLCVLPMLHELAISFSSVSAAQSGRVTLWPVEFTTDSYAYMLKNKEFWTAMWVSVKRIILGGALSMFLTFIAAYPLSRSSEVFPQRKFYVWIIFFTMLFTGGLIPGYLVVKYTGLINTIWALVIPGAVNSFNIVLMLNFFRQLPKELDEAAFIDGATHWTVLWQIYLPLSGPSIATITLFTAVGAWNAWFDGMLFMNRPEFYPLQTYLRGFIINNDSALMSLGFGDDFYKHMSQETLKAAQIMVGVLPILLLYPFLQKHFAKGVMLGSVKG